jgi:inhibitor of cysteine peptidase
LSKGSLLELTLYTNPTTGYDWNITKHDKSILMLISEKRLGFDSPPFVCGAGHLITWTFKAINNGITTLQLQYYKPYSPNNIIEMTYNIIIVVNEYNVNEKINSIE